ncbi:tandem-95 repeat protein, partial [Fastidiosibacter lacustris]|uniref:tandem-95 repeat protein n=1 Tax=Fastidiosibacter lacustris TaxID=2056695 RepID=UPI000E3471A2
NLSAVHIVSHGDVGKLYLGNEALSLDNIGDYAASLAQWGKALSNTGDILFYGCNVAEGQQGQAFVEALRSYTDADIAASIDTTASQDNGGDSILEYGQAIDNSEILHFEGYAHRLDNPAIVVGATHVNISQLGVDIIGETDGHQTGWSVSLSADGMTMAIGARQGEDVRIYSWSGNGWVQKGGDIDGEAAGDYFGYSVSLSADGNTVAIGAIRNDGSGTDSGHVRVYSWNGTTWVQKGGEIDGEIAGDNFGHSVSLSADGLTVAIGAINNDGGASSTDNRGHVRIYSWNGTSWEQKGLDIDGEAAGGNSGHSVSLSADGNTVAISAPYNDGTTGNTSDNRGHVRIYSWNGTSWEQKGLDIDGEGGSSMGDQSGWSVSLSADGNTVAIGAPFHDGSNIGDSGTVRIYKWNGSAWVNKGSDIDGSEGSSDYSGWSVSLSADGNTVAIGAPNNDGGASVTDNRGSVRIYKWNGNNWVKYGSDIDGKFTNAQSGYSVSLSADGSKVALGGPAYSISRGIVSVYSVVPRYTVNEDTTLAMNDISLNDIDGNLSTARLQVTNGVLNVTLSGAAVVSLGANGSNDLTISGTQAEINATLASLSYQGNLNFNGSDTLTLTATDSGSSSAVQLIAINVNAANDAPTAMDNTVVINEDSIYVFTANDFNFADLDGNTLASVKITTLPMVGSLRLNGVAVTLNQVITKANIDAGLLTFTPANNGNGSNYASFGFKVNDGAIDSVSTYTMSIDVTPVNDAPEVLLGGAAFTTSKLGADIDGEATGDQSGSSVSLSADGMTMAIGARNNDGNGGDSGHVRIYSWNTLTLAWVQKGADINGEVAGDNFGLSVSLSADGNTIAIGANANDGNGSNSGHVRIYSWNGANWVPKGGDIDGEAANNYSGESVSLSADGNTVAIGAPYNDNANGIDAGHVRIYSWNGANWVPKGGDIDGEAANNYSGSSVSLSADGNTVAIGASYNDGTTGNASDDRGHVQIYSWNSVTSTWDKFGQDIDGEAPGDRSGFSVSLSADGLTVAIGAYNNDGTTGNITDNRGHVRIYSWNSVTSTWDKLGQDIDGEAVGDFSGWSVSLSADGNTVAIGAYNNDGTSGSSGDNRGHTRIYKWNGTNWVKYGADIDGEAAGDFSGSSVSLSADGNMIAISATQNDGSGGSTDNRGHVRVYSLIPRYTVNEDTALAINNISINDVDGNLSTARLQVTNGVLNVTLSGAAVVSLGANGSNDLTISGTQAEINATLASLSYQGNLNFNGSDTLTLTATDSGSSSAVQLIAINVNAINDAPILTAPVTNIVLEEGHDLTFNGANLISVSDVDATQLTINFLVNDGILILPSVSGLTFLNGTTNNSANIQFSGTLSAISDALTGMIYRPNANFTGSVTLMIVVSDMGQTGTGGTQLANKNVSIDVMGFNQPFIGLTGALFDIRQLGTDIDGEAIGEQLGHSVSLSADGNTLAVGTVMYNGLQGQVRVYSWNASILTWEQKGLDIDGEATGDQSGSSVSLSADGNTVAIGGPYNDGNDFGHVRIYNWTGAVWEQKGLDINGDGVEDHFGWSVSLSADGNTVAIATPHDDNANGNDAGHVRIYSWNTATSTWEQKGGDIDGESAFDWSGYSVSLSADGNTVAIGAPYNDGNDFGHVRIYNWTGAVWEQKGLDINGDGVEDHFGWSVSLSADGNTVAIATPHDDNANGNDAGHVRIYKWNGSVWVQKGGDIDGESIVDFSGYSMSLSADGNTVAISAPFAGSNDVGQVRIYKWNGSSWVKYGMDIDGENSSDNSGFSVALSADGSTVAISSRNNDGAGSDAGHVRVYRLIPLYEVNEDAPLTINGLSVSDVDGNLESARLQVTNGRLNITLSGATVISAGSNGSSDLTLTGTQTDINATLASLIYQGNLNFNGSDTLTVTATDDMAFTRTQSIDITIHEVADLPTGTNKTITIDEDNTYVLSVADFGYSDPENDAFTEVRITILESAGALKFNGVDVTLNQLITKADIENGLLTFTPANNGNGVSYASFNFRVRNALEEAATGATITFDVTPVNDAPSISGLTTSSPYTESAADDSISPIKLVLDPSLFL